MPQYPPPQTVRPPCPIVDALERDDAGAAVVQLLRDALEPGAWSVPTDHGFWWVPHRTRHLVEAVELADADGVMGTVLRSDITVVDRVADDVQALAMCHYLGQRSFGGVVYLDEDDRSIHVVTCVRLSPATWFAAQVVVLTVPRLVAMCERLAPRLAAWVDGAVPDASHPTLGRRAEASPLVTDVELLGDVPEASTGSWWSAAEVRGLRLALRHVLGERGAEPDAALLDPDEYDESLTAAANLSVDVRVPSRMGLSWFTVGQSEHPDLGRVVEILHVSPVRFDGSGDLDGPPTSGLAAMVATNSINALSAVHCPHGLLMGGLTSWRGQLCRSTVLLPEVVRTVQHLGLTTVGEAFGLVAASTLGLHDFTATMVELFDGRNTSSVGSVSVDDLPTASVGPLLSGDSFGGTWTSVDRPLWRGVAENAGHHSLLVDDRALFAALPDGPSNTVCEPVTFDPRSGNTLDEAVWSVQRSVLLAQWGIFNPLGPTVGSLEVAIDYVGGRGYVLERLRHPFGPQVSLRAVIDIEGFAALGDIVGAVVDAWMAEGGSTYALPHWFEVVSDIPDVVTALRDGLHGLAVANDADLAAATVAAVASVGSPWNGFTAAERHADDVQQLRELSIDDLAGEWVEAVTHPRVIDAHVAWLRSAWDGSRAFVGDPDGAQRVVVALEAELDRRVGGRR